ncbi:MAG: response regulator [Caldilineales bacterium]
MTYTVFFVEDEIVTREGIRDRVDWRANGFELCGEAPDGEIALPLLQTLRPDVLITDIKMPFMDGLELSRIVRERLPATRIIFLSGHDEFEYAQSAIKLGVTEYLLKPVTVRDIDHALQRVAAELDRERQSREALNKLRSQVQETQDRLRERLLLDLVVGAVSSAQAIEKAEQLGLDLLARAYLVAVIKIELTDPQSHFDLHAYRQTHRDVEQLVESDPDVFLIKKDLEEIVLILKGDAADAVVRRNDALRAQLAQQTKRSGCRLVLGSGGPKHRITDICTSFVEGLAALKSTPYHNGNGNGVSNAELLKINQSAVEGYLKCGARDDVDEFLDTFVLPLGGTVLESAIVRNYVLMDVVLTTANFLHELGGSTDQIIPDLDVIARISGVDELCQQVRAILTAALAFRDAQVGSIHTGTIQQACTYIDSHYGDSNLSLPEVASRAHLSPSHFCTVFSQETGQSFKEYLTEVRIQRAQELLRTTALKSFEIADQIGYGDPHYFSYVFRKHTGVSPTAFRSGTRPAMSRPEVQE